jgi:hypothetical protein
MSLGKISARKSLLVTTPTKAGDISSWFMAGNVRAKMPNRDYALLLMPLLVLSPTTWYYVSWKNFCW